MAADRAKAVQRLQSSLKLQRLVLMARHSLPKLLVETQLLLAEMDLEKGDITAAAALFQPLVEAAKAAQPAKPETLDHTTLASTWGRSAPRWRPTTSRGVRRRHDAHDAGPRY